jgi:TonB-like protein
VTACTIVESAGRQYLDKLACRTLMNARFTPARDKDGNPVESHFFTPPVVLDIDD